MAESTSQVLKVGPGKSAQGFATSLAGTMTTAAITRGLVLASVAMACKTHAAAHIPNSLRPASVMRGPAISRARARVEMGPPLPSEPVGMARGDGGPVVEVFLDLACPFSVKSYKTIRTLPPSAATVIIHQVPQPWHPHSTLLHEAALAVRQLAPERYFDFFGALCDAFDQYTEDKLVDETRAQTMLRLCALAEEKVGVSAKAVEELLEHPRASTGGNAGCKMTQWVKWCVKHHRARGVHVTPTVFVHGIQAPQIDSSLSAEGWLEILQGLRR